MGQTVRTFAERKTQHLEAAKYRRGDCRKLGNYLRKYGASAVWEILADGIPDHKLDEAEVRAIAQYRSFADVNPLGLNLKSGGGRSTYSAESRARMSAAHKGKKLSPETCARMSEARKGEKKGPVSDQTRANMSAARLGKKLGPMPPAHKQSLSRALTGRQLGDETIQRMSQARRGLTDAELARLHELRAKGMSQREVGIILGVDQSVVSRAQRGLLQYINPAAKPRRPRIPRT